MNTHNRKWDVTIIGGLGHVGLPLGLSFANEGLKVCLYDIDTQKADLVRSGKMPFIEYGAEPILTKVLQNGNLDITADISTIPQAKFLIITVGTPVDEHLSPNIKPFLELIENIKKYIDKEQILIVRSTVYPRTCGHNL